jgi:hypothetical protein
MARMLSKKVFNELDGQLWPSKMNSGLDYTMMAKIKSYEGFTWRSFSIKGMTAVDIKGQGNITRLINYDENLTEVDISTFDTIPEFSLIRKL